MLGHRKKGKYLRHQMNKYLIPATKMFYSYGVFSKFQ